MKLHCVYILATSGWDCDSVIANSVAVLEIEGKNVE